MKALEKATASWGENMPDWVRIVAAECDRMGQRATGKRVGYSATTLNMVLANKYGRDSTTGRGTIEAVEQAVRGTLMNEKVNCPIIGDIPTDMCLRNQKAGWAPHNPQRIQLYHACRDGCVHSRIGGKS